MHLPSLLAERRLLPDSFIRWGIRQQLKAHSKELLKNPKADSRWIEELSRGPIAVATQTSKEQHYEVPTDYFLTVLGPHLKYSACLWESGQSDLAAAEQAMLSLSAQRAQLTDGQSILELGCGWGSFSLWMAEQYPNSQITAMSHSTTQKAYIDSQAAKRGLTNLEVLTCDINHFNTHTSYDRIVSIEMFEHLRNHRALFDQLASWLKPDGKLFVHIFTHFRSTYLFEVEHERDWMAEHFFTGGMMPSVELLPLCAEAFIEDERWAINGRHYSQTLEAWLKKQDAAETTVLHLFKETYGKDARLWLQRWRIFYLACSELFAYQSGNEWAVTHYLFSKK